MKSKLLIAVSCFIAACGLITAQQPAPSPTPAPAPSQPQANMTLPPQSQAALVAGQIIAQVTGLLNNAIQVIDNGMPAQPNQPAVSAADVQAALGTENVMKLRSAVALLSGQPVAKPSPTPAPKK